MPTIGTRPSMVYCFTEWPLVTSLAFPWLGQALQSLSRSDMSKDAAALATDSAAIFWSALWRMSRDIMAGGGVSLTSNYIGMFDCSPARRWGNRFRKLDGINVSPRYESTLSHTRDGEWGLLSHVSYPCPAPERTVGGWPARLPNVDDAPNPSAQRSEFPH